MRHLSLAAARQRMMDLAPPWRDAFLFIGGLTLLHAGRLIASSPLPLLHGDNLIYFIGEFSMVSAVLLTASRFLRTQGADDFCLVLFVISSIASLHYLSISSENAYTNDISGHVDYASFISGHWLHPYQYKGYQSHQAPTYYYLAGAAVWVAKTLRTISVMTALRFLSWTCYLAFNAFGLLTLRRSGITGASQYACAALLLFWPGGMHLASKISNEPCFFAAYAACFYYAVCWYQEGKERQLMMAVLLAGVALTIRTNAIILFMILAALITTAWLRRRFSLRNLLSWRWAIVGMALGACVWVLWGRIQFLSVDGGGGGPRLQNPLPPGYFLFFSYNDFIAHPFNDWSARGGFWDFLLKTSLFGEYQWPQPFFGLTLDMLALAIALYAFLPWPAAKRQEWRGMLPFAAGVAAPLMVQIGYVLWRMTFTAQDARYVYPMLPCLVVFFGRSIDFFKARDTYLLSRLGPLLAWSFSLFSLIFFWQNAR